MYKKLVITLLISATLLPIVNAQWVALKNKSNSIIPPNITLISDNDQNTVIKIDICGFEMKEFYSGENKFQGIDLLSEIFISKQGYPELPYLAKVLAIPDNGGISVEVLETSEVEVFKNIHVQPARKSWIEGEPETAYKENIEAYQSNDIYPNEYASIEPPSIFRDFRIARLSVFPVRYIPAKNEIHVVSSITVRIVYGKGEAVNPKKTSKKSIAPSFGKLYRSFIFNYQNVLDNRFNGRETGHDVMLCIMPDENTDSFQPYADWKRKSGTDVHVTKFSDIGANAYNTEIIKNHISDAYHNWEHPPTYVLLVGDATLFPVKIVNYDYSFANEDFFVEIDGDDFFPEMMIGRLTNQNDYTLQVMLNKFIKYERTPHTENVDWFKKAVCCSNNLFESQVNTKRITANLMLLDGGFTSVDTLMSDGSGGGYGCTVDLDDVISSINEGRSFLNYRGEGWSDGWGASCYQFNTWNVSTLNNGEKLTFVTSIGCGVARFDEYDGNCFGEEWLELGTIDSPRGAIAFVGPTSNTHTTYNNRIDKGIYTGMFQEGMDTPGQALLRGKLYVYNVFGDDPMVEYNYRVFCVLGDPSVHIWKDVPVSVNVVHETVLPVGYSQTEISVTSALTGEPMVNAQVCLAGDDIYNTSICDSTGKVSLILTTEVLQTISVTVRGGNVIPYEGTISVEQTPEHVAPQAHPIIVDIDGNNDGIINPNENCTISTSLKNWGIQTSNNVKATLSAVETNFVEVITSSPVNFGDISSGQSTSENSFQFRVLPDCPVGQIITLNLHITSTTSSWDYSYQEEVMGCNLVFNNLIVDDEGSLIHNYKMDPGETVKLYIMVGNIGMDAASQVRGVLSSNDPYITIEDSIGNFGTLETNSVGVNSSNYFVVSVDPNCPAEYYASYLLKLNTQDGNYPYSNSFEIIIPVAVPTPRDYTGPDSYGYYAYSNEDTIYYQSPVYDWVEINEVGEKIMVLYTGDYTETVDLPFSFKFYGSDYDKLRISIDGWIAFGSGIQTQPINFPMPNPDNVDCMVAAFWDDLYCGYFSDDDIYYYYDDNNHRFIIEWDGVFSNDNNLGPQTTFFQAILLDPEYYKTESGDGEIIIQYKDIKITDSNTIGIEDDTELIGLQYVCDAEYVPTASILKNETAIKFTTEIPLITASVNEDKELIKVVSNLDQNIPNPFKYTTSIGYDVLNPTNVSIIIYNNNGKLVKTLYEGHQLTGKYLIVWDGTNEAGIRMNSGIYFYRLTTDNSVETKKLFMVK